VGLVSEQKTCNISETSKIPILARFRDIAGYCDGLIGSHMVLSICTKISDFG